MFSMWFWECGGKQLLISAITISSSLESDEDELDDDDDDDELLV